MTFNKSRKVQKTFLDFFIIASISWLPFCRTSTNLKKQILIIFEFSSQLCYYYTLHTNLLLFTPFSFSFCKSDFFFPFCIICQPMKFYFYPTVTKNVLSNEQFPRVDNNSFPVLSLQYESHSNHCEYSRFNFYHLGLLFLIDLF